MTTYRLHGVAFESSLDLPELDATTDPPVFRIVECRLADAGHGWIDPWQRDPRGPWIRIQAGDGYRIRYQDQVDFHLNADGGAIAIDVRDCPPATVRHFLLDQVIPLALSTRDLVLHASAVSIDDHLVAFTGPSGAGKSSIAALLARAGFPVAADDAMLVRVRKGQLEGIPAYPGVRLWPDMVEACALDPSPLPVSESSLKRRVRGGLAFDGRPRPLSAIYVLGEVGPAVTLRALSRRQTAMTLIEQAFRLELRDPRALVKEMDRACEVAAHARAWALGVPRDHARREKHVAAVVAHLRSRVGVTCCS